MSPEYYRRRRRAGAPGVPATIFRSDDDIPERRRYSGNDVSGTTATMFPEASGATAVIFRRRRGPGSDGGDVPEASKITATTFRRRQRRRR
jgi:hypothetical protein